MYERVTGVLKICTGKWATFQSIPRRKGLSDFPTYKLHKDPHCITSWNVMIPVQNYGNAPTHPGKLGCVISLIVLIEVGVLMEFFGKETRLDPCHHDLVY